MLDVDAIAQEIRRVDGNNSLGAGQLAEALMPFLEAALRAGGEPVAFMHADHIEQYKNKTADGIFWANRERTEFYTVPLYAHPSDMARELAEARTEAEKAEAERVKEWNRRRDAEASRDVERAATDTMRAERDALAANNARLALEAKRHAIELEQCAIFAADVGPSIAKAMTDAALWLREIDALASIPAPADKEPPSIDYLRGQIGEILALELDADEGGRALSQAVERILSLIATSPADKAEARREALEEAAAAASPNRGGIVGEYEQGRRDAAAAIRTMLSARPKGGA